MFKKIAVTLAAATLPLAAGAAPETYRVDPYHSFPHFEVDHLGMMLMRGRFDKMEGTFTIDTAAKSGSVEVTIQTTSLTTGDNDRGPRPRSRDEHLRSPDFFNVAEFPTMTFKGTAAQWDGDAPKRIDGQLTLLGVTKPVSLEVLRWRCGPDPRTKGARYMCGANVAGAFKRSDFGMKFIVGPVSDEVKLWIGMEAFRQ